ncbi:MAG: Mrp/NBP35 family ATP-binding protein [Marinilabiliales bacterium]|nr:Mrp/NBP35 family ATP-binding protein [Marinilabiliales bacterium]
MALIPKNISDTLAKILYPGTDKNIVAMEMVQEIRTAGRRVSFSLIFQREDDPAVATLTEACIDLLKREHGQDLEISIVPKSVARMSPPVMPGVKNIIAVASGKGGVGKSTMAVNLAVALAQQGASVGLVDADIFGPSIPKMFGEEDTRPYFEKIDGRDRIVPVEKYGVKFLSIGFFANKNDALIWRGPVASNALKQLMMEGNWGNLDYLLIDLPPGTSDIHLTLVQTVAVTGAVIVTTPQEVALADVVKGVSMFASKSINVPVLGIVENMSWFTPAELPNNRYYLFGKDGGKELADKLGIPLLGQIPLVMGIREGGDNGEPAAANEDTATGVAFAQLARMVVEQLEKRNLSIEPTEKVKVSRK